MGQIARGKNKKGVKDMWTMVLAGINTGLIFFYDSKINFSIDTKIDIIFYTIIFISLLSIFEVMKSNQILKEMEIEKIYQEGQMQGRRDQASLNGTKPDTGEY